MGLVSSDDGWRLPDWLWERVESLLPPRPRHPLGCHRPRVSDRAAMDAVLLVLRTGQRCRIRQRLADTKRTQQKRHARPLARLVSTADQAYLREKSCRR